MYEGFNIIIIMTVIDSMNHLVCYTSGIKHFNNKQLSYRFRSVYSITLIGYLYLLYSMHLA